MEHLHPPPLILASASPRRAQLLKQIHLPFVVKVSTACEERNVSCDPIEHVLELSRRKAENVSARVQTGLVLGVDTIVVLNGHILGKPNSHEEAKHMLRCLSGRTHNVFSGLTLIRAEDGELHSDYSRTEVNMRTLSEEEIEAYVATGEPLDKAGAYGIQGRAAPFVEEIHGCYYNVVGLPLSKLVEMLKVMGWRWDARRET
jgi:septum formation protein